MRNIFHAIALATVAFAAAAVAPPIGGYGGLELDASPGRRRGKGQNNRRGKGKRNSRKSHPNRLTIGKRVRAKHRRHR